MLANTVFILAILCFGLLPASSVCSERYALLVGVSDYSFFPENSVGQSMVDLVGPKHDIARMIMVARHLGVADSNLIVLADGLSETDVNRTADGLPTYQKIVAALTHIQHKAKAGDQILFYFSGHGTQVPDQPKGQIGTDEPDGKDEVLLPQDVSGWDEVQGTLTNALTDDELGLHMDAIRSKGAHVLAIIDACHSGSVLRGSDEKTSIVEVRMIHPDVLGIPENTFSTVQPGILKRSENDVFELESSHQKQDSEQKWGQLTAFYAASENQLAIASRWLNDDGSFTPVMGLLTYAISESLANTEIRHYAELALRVRHIYNLNRRFQVTPAFEGDFDRNIFGDLRRSVQRWKIHRVGDEIVVAAGKLDGLHEGSILAVTRVDENDATVIAYAQVAFSAPRYSKLMPVSYNNIPASAIEKVGRLGSYEGVLTVRKASNRLAVGLPALSLAGHSAVAPIEVVREAKSMLENEPDKYSFDFVSGSFPRADVYLRVGEDRVWFTESTADFESTGRLQPPFHLVLADDDVARPANTLLEKLQAVARSRLLLKELQKLESHAAELLKIDIFVLQLKASMETLPCPEPQWLPNYVPTEAKRVEQLSPQLNLHNCDLVFVTTKNITTSPVDVTPLYFDREFNISYLQSNRREGVRIMPGDSLTTMFQINTYDHEQQRPYALGTEQLAILAVKQAGDQVPPVSYAYLATTEETLRSAVEPIGLDETARVYRYAFEVSVPHNPQ